MKVANEKGIFINAIKDMWNISGIYKITNLINGKIYIGQSVDMGKRWWKGHILPLRRCTHENNHLQGSWNKYGEENFKFEVVAYIDDEATRDVVEEYLIRTYDSTSKHIGYNISLSAKGSKGCKHSDGAILKIIERNSGENNYLSTLTNLDVIEIKKILRDKSMPVLEIARKFNVNRTVISNIKAGRNWNHIKVDGFVENGDFYNGLLTEDEIKEIKKMIMEGYTQKGIACIFGVSSSHIGKIGKGKIEADIFVEGFMISTKVWKKLCTEDILKIKKMLRLNILTQTEIANLFSVSPQLINDIKMGRKYSGMILHEADLSAK